MKNKSWENTPRTPITSISLLKVEIPLVKNNIFNVSNTVRTVFSTLKNIQGGNSHF